MFNTILYAILGTLALIGVIYLIFKFPQSRIYVFSFLGIALIGLTAYSGVNLHYYYNEQGGIFGYISGIFETNTLVVEDLSFSLNNIEMTETSEGVYSASVVDNKTISSLEVGEKYTVFINGAPCSDVITASDYVSANYEYNFYDEDFKVLCHDTLHINFAFNKNGTYMSVSTKGGSEAVKYWNYYFQKQNFVVDIKVSEYKPSEDIYISGEYNKNEIVTVSYYINGEKTCGQVYKKGDEIKLIECQEENFYCWSLTPKEEGVNSLVDYQCNKDLNLYAIFMTQSDLINAYNVTFKVRDEVVSSQLVYENNVASDVSVKNTRYYDFAGWTINNELVDTTNYNITENTTFVAMINYKNITLTAAEEEQWNTLCANIYDAGANPNHYVGSTILSVEKLTNGINLLCKLPYNGTKEIYWIAYFEGVQYKDVTDVFTYYEESLNQCKTYDDVLGHSNVVKITAINKEIEVSEYLKLDYVNKKLGLSLKSLNDCLFKYSCGISGSVKFTSIIVTYKGLFSYEYYSSTSTTLNPSEYASEVINNVFGVEV